MACTLLFAVSAAATIVLCASMSTMGMPMPGNWTMSMAWMKMPGQTWLGAAASFVGMWIVMMVAMMLPSLMPVLWRYREALAGAAASRPGRSTALVGVGYFVVWAVFGIIVYPIGAFLAAVEMQQPSLARAVPIAVGVIVAIAGALQFSAWKSHHLACCQDPRGFGGSPALVSGAALRHGVCHGLHCACCCAGLMVVLLVGGVMDLTVMAAVTAAITIERFASDGDRAARAIGGVVLSVGFLLIARGAGSLLGAV